VSAQLNKNKKESNLHYDNFVRVRYHSNITAPFCNFDYNLILSAKLKVTYSSGNKSQ